MQLKNSKKIIMNKAELISKLADDAGITKTQANAALDSFVTAVTKTLKKNPHFLRHRANNPEKTLKKRKNRAKTKN